MCDTDPLDEMDANEIRTKRVCQLVSNLRLSTENEITHIRSGKNNIENVTRQFNTICYLLAEHDDTTVD